MKMRKPWTQEQKAKQSQRLLEHFRTHDAPMKGRTFSEEHRNKLSQAKLGVKQSPEVIAKRFAWRGKKKPKPFSIEARNNCSLAAVKRIIKYGIPYNRSQKGLFFSNKMGKQLRYRSGWERLVYQSLEIEPNVYAYTPEPIAIPYEFNGSIHNYLPDILVEWSNGHKDLLEIKPKFKMSDPKVKAKLEAATLYALNNGWGFNVIDEDDIKKLKGGE